MALAPGYQLIEKIFEKGNKSLYRAAAEEEKDTVILKILSDQDIESPDLLNLRREYEISNTLDHKYLIKPVNYLEFNGGAAIVMEDFAGVSLKEMLRQGPLPLKDFLRIALLICEALGYIHSKGIIHKDIKPANILINAQKDEIRLIDFGLAALIPQEEIVQESSKVLEGSLRYMSPEQSGRMNRVLDYRTDMYSLGVTFYELLVGHPPFQSEDPMELVHAHLAIKPTAPTLFKPQVPEVISVILLKLLEKSSEDRYKSIAGLKADLEKCLTQLKEKGSIFNFLIAQQDVSDRLSIPQKLYGRSEEITQLMQVFEKVCRGASEFLLVSGNPGIGKSVLINEVQKPIIEKRGIFITGKFDQFQRDIPYSGIIQAFQELIRNLLTAREQAIQEWKQVILAQVGPHGRLIIDVIPELEYIIGYQPEVTPLPPTESANRFKLVFQRFVKAFSSGPTPLVIFLDDLQWADVSSLDLMNFVLSDRHTSYLLIIGAFRDNEVRAGHPLTNLISEVQKERSVERIHLEPLKIGDLEKMLQSTFSSSAEEIPPLAELVFAKTKGNPFFVFEFIKSLYKKKLVAFDYATNKWKWSICDIQKSNITENVVELMTDLLFSLGEKTRKLCSLAAGIGNQFDLHTLAIVNESSVQETARNLWEAIEEGIVIPISDSYKFTNTNPTLAAQTNYKFLHDRVQQAAYSIIPAGDRAPIHLKIGQLLNEKLEEAEREKLLFDITNHLNQGAELITNREERLHLVDLNFKAGLKAKNSSAFAPAFRYFSTAINLLPDNHWEADYRFTLKAFNEAVETAYLSGKETEMEQYAARIFQHATSLLDKVQAYTVRIQAHGSNGRHEEAVRTSFEVLSRLGVTLPANPGQLSVLRELVWTKLRLRGKSVEELATLPEMTSRHWLSAMSVLSIVTGPAYIANTNLFVLIVFKMIELSIKHGNNRYTSFAYAVYGMVLSGPLMQLDQVVEYGKLSARLLEQYRADELSCKVNYALASLKHWNHPLRKSAEIMVRNIQLGLETGDFLYTSYAVFFYLNYKFYAGTHLPSLKKEMDEYCSMLEGLKQKVGLGWANTIMQVIANLINKETIDTALAGDYYHEEERLPAMEEGKDKSGICLLYIQKGQLCYLFNEYEKAETYLKTAASLIDSVTGTNLINSHNFYNGLTFAVLPSNDSFVGRQRNIFRLRRYIDTQQKWARFSPENNLARLELLKAELCRLQGKPGAAHRHYQLAVNYAGKYGFIQEEALSHELRGKYYLELGDSAAAQKHLLEARFLFNKWGASAKVRQMEQLYHLKPVSEKTLFIDSDMLQTTGTFSTDTLDLHTALKASQTLSSEVQLDELFKKMTYIVMENAGATKCTILLKQDDGTWMQEISRETIEGKDSELLRQIEADSANADMLSVPLNIISYVRRSGESLIINNATADPAYNDDPYIRKTKPKSVLCFPLYSQGVLNGIIYLENNLTTGAFTEDRMRLLSIISSQIAISIENARLYKNLELRVKERTAKIESQKDEIEAEKQKADDLLLNILPAEIAAELKDHGSVRPRRFEKVSVMFTDFVQFSKLCERLQAEEIIEMLNAYYSGFDRITSERGLEKIKTIGDSYMCAAGLPVESDTHARDIVQAALEIQQFVSNTNRERQQKGLPVLDSRIGIHSGAVIAGLVGTKKFAYDIWGDSVNIASRMETAGAAGKVNISGQTYELIKGDFEVEHRGQIEVKNKGTIEMYFVKGKSGI